MAHHLLVFLDEAACAPIVQAFHSMIMLANRAGASLGRLDIFSRRGKVSCIHKHPQSSRGDSDSVKNDDSPEVYPKDEYGESQDRCGNCKH